MTQNKKIAVTGAIGSGKTAFCNILREMGYPVFSCDEISNELWENADYLEGLARLFPACVEDGKPQKKLLARLVFSDRSALEKLNSYAHPRIMELLLKRMRNCRVAIAEVPLLFEGGFEGLFDEVVIVSRNREARAKSIASRDGLSESEIAARMGAQKDLSSICGEKYIVAENNGTLEDLEESALRIVRRLGI